AVDVGEEAHAAAAPAHASHASASHSHGHADDQSHGHGGVHESPWIMLAPLVILAVLSFVGGWVGVPKFMGGHNEIARFLSPVLESPGNVGAERLEAAENGQAAPKEEEHASEEWALASTSVAAALLGLFFAWLLYYKRPELPDRITAKIHGIYLTVLHKYYIDEAYNQLFVKPLLAL